MVQQKQEQFQETLYLTLSPETLEKFRHLRPKKELWRTSWTADGLYDCFNIFICIKTLFVMTSQR